MTEETLAVDEPLPEPVEAFFRGGLPGPTGDAFRLALREGTSRIVRRRRWRRRVLVAGALAACFLAGAACVQCLRHETSPSGTQQAQMDGQPPAHPAPVPKQLPESPTAVAALAAEWNAFDDRVHKPELYRQAGDLYVQEDQDYESALRCYTQALDAASDQDLAISPDDNWLLMALKDARQKEKNDAHTGG